MTFERKAHVVFWISIGMILTACVIAIQNDRKVEGLSYWLFLGALVLFVAGMPAFINYLLRIAGNHRPFQAGRTSEEPRQENAGETGPETGTSAAEPPPARRTGGPEMRKHRALRGRHKRETEDRHSGEAGSEPANPQGGTTL